MELSASWNKEARQFGALQNNSLDYAKKIVLANKGESGYLPVFDADDNGIVTLEEFNKYCEENGVGEKERVRLLMSMQNAKNTQALQDEEDDNRIYARRGDDKYVEEMDENKDNIITYDEYIKYCDEQARINAEKNEDLGDSKNNIDPQVKKAINAYKYKKEDIVQMEIDSII